MRRGVIAVDRAVGVTVALALVAAGIVVGYQWHTPYAIDTPPDRTHATWWPWATGAAGTLLVLLGLWWLARHLPRRTSGRFTLPADGNGGRLVADAQAAAGAAAAGLAELPEIRDASGRVVLDRGELVAEINCMIEPSADLAVVRAAVTSAAADLHSVVGLPDLRHRVRLRVARSDRTTAPARVV